MDYDEQSEVNSPISGLKVGVGMVGGPSRKPEIAQELDALNRVTKDVKELTATLADKLMPITHGNVPTEARPKTASRETAVAQSIQSQVHELVDIRDALKQILSRLEL